MVNPYAIASQSGLTNSGERLSEVCESPLNVFLVNVDPQSLFIDDYLINIKYAENVLQLYVWQQSITQKLVVPQFVIHENEHVLASRKKVCAKFAHACNLGLIALKLPQLLL